MIVRFIDNNGIVDHHCFNFLFKCRYWKHQKTFWITLTFFFFKFRTFDLSTLYTIIRSEKLIICLIEISTTHFTLKKRQATLHAYGFWSWTNLFCQARNCYTIYEVISMLELLIDNIFVKIGGHIKNNIIDIPMGRNCAPLLVDIFPFFLWSRVYTKYCQRQTNYNG